MNLQKHLKHQSEYFNNEFKSMTDYTLSRWQESYMMRIKKFVLRRYYKNKVLIDIASGSGYVAIEAAKLGLRVIATDFSSQSIKNLNAYKKKFKLSKLKIIQCRAEKLTLPNNSVDYLIANAILEHIYNEEQAISEWKRVLKKGGRIYITVPLKYYYIFPFLWLPNFIHDRRIGHLRRYDKETLERKFELPVIKTIYTGHIVKIFAIITSKIMRTNKYDDYFELQDIKQEERRYGANNISVVFEKK